MLMITKINKLRSRRVRPKVLENEICKDCRPNIKNYE